MKRVTIIGGGFSGLSAACYSAKQGHEVTLLEKNSTIGGRARFFNRDGFTFDMGPSWYWMPDVFEKFFNDFGKTTADFYNLIQLDPGFKIYFGNQPALNVPANKEELLNTFESIEKGSATKLAAFLKEAELKYDIGMSQLAYKPSISWSEFMNLEVLSGVLKTKFFSSVRSTVRKTFKDERLVALMEFPVLFLGTKPQDTPSLYTLMNHAALSQGTYYPMGGMLKITEAFANLATSLGVKIITDCNVLHIGVNNGSVSNIETNKGVFTADAVIGSADYHHIEQHLLDKPYRNYDEKYWKGRTLAPSALIYYIGVNKKIKNLSHHNLFFDANFEKHTGEIYDQPAWPEDPLFYLCAPSVTDPHVAPEGHENLFVLIPIAPGLKDTQEVRDRYLSGVIKRIEKETGDTIASHILFSQPYSISDYIKDYNAFKGNAYGLANTLFQTAVLKPSVRSKKVKNLFYAGQLTVPGPGVPPAIISGEIAAGQVNKYLKQKAA